MLQLLFGTCCPLRFPRLRLFALALPLAPHALPRPGRPPWLYSFAVTGVQLRVSRMYLAHLHLRVHSFTPCVVVKGMDPDTRQGDARAAGPAWTWRGRSQAPAAAGRSGRCARGRWGSLLPRGGRPGARGAPGGAGGATGRAGRGPRRCGRAGPWPAPRSTPRGRCAGRARHGGRRSRPRW